ASQSAAAISAVSSPAIHLPAQTVDPHQSVHHHPTPPRSPSGSPAPMPRLRDTQIPATPACSPAPPDTIHPPPAPARATPPSGPASHRPTAGSSYPTASAAPPSIHPVHTSAAEPAPSPPVPRRSLPSSRAHNSPAS